MSTAMATRSWNIALKPEQLWFNDLLRNLHATGLLRVTGSYADGTATDSSDLDFYVREDTPDTPLTRTNMRIIALILKAFDLPLGSAVTGHISVGYPPHMGVSPIQLEFSNLFQHRPNRDKTVEINGLTFRTW